MMEKINDKYHQDFTWYFPFVFNTNTGRKECPIWVLTDNKKKATKWIESKKASWKSIPPNIVFILQVKTEKNYII
jgi:hypothetical protein